jgi:HAD superfamily hydrolase (TIGR01509 family)
MSVHLLVDGEIAHSSPKVMLFDKDGTLIDIHHYWVSMIRIRADRIVQRWFLDQKENRQMKDALIDAMGVDLKTGRMKPEGPVGIKPRTFIVSVVAQKVRDAGCDISDDEMESLFVEVDQLTAQDLLPLLRLLPGVESLLQQIDECQVPSVIVSTDITSRARKAMEVLQLDRYFAAIIGADQVENTKPAPDLAELALQHVNVEMTDAVVIGDHPVDVQMGLAAGVGLSIGVLTGLSSKSAFREYECQVVADLTSISMVCSHVG